MEKTIKNTEFNNLVNYITEKSSGDVQQHLHYNSVDPTSLSDVIKNNQIIKYNLLDVSEKEITRPNNNNRCTSSLKNENYGFLS